jgi:hypothetical protein
MSSPATDVRAAGLQSRSDWLQVQSQHAQCKEITSPIACIIHSRHNYPYDDESSVTGAHVGAESVR